MTSRQVSTLCAPLSDPVSTLMLTAGISMLASGLLSVWNYASAVQTSSSIDKIYKCFPCFKAMAIIL